MTNGIEHYAHRRGQRTDLHILSLRQEAEGRYGQLLTDAVTLRRKLEDPSLPEAEYDAGVVGLVCSGILAVRPMPSYLRSALAGLLSLDSKERSRLMKIDSTLGPATMLRSDRAWVELVMASLGRCLYPTDSYLEGLTDIGCGLEGLRLTWSRDVVNEADTSGVISLEGVRRIRDKLVEAIAQAEYDRNEVLRAPFGDLGPTLKVSPDWSQQLTGRRLALIALVEHAASIGSPLMCVESRVREDRLSHAWQHAPRSTPARAGSQ